MPLPCLPSVVCLLITEIEEQRELETSKVMDNDIKLKVESCRLLIIRHLIAHSRLHPRRIVLPVYPKPIDVDRTPSPPAPETKTDQTEPNNLPNIAHIQLPQQIRTQTHRTNMSPPSIHADPDNFDVGPYYRLVETIGEGAYGVVK